MPLSEPDLAVGPVFVTEPRMLAVHASHPLAGRPGVSMEDLADIRLLRLEGALPGDWPSDRWLERTPAGRGIPSGSRFATFQEAMQLVGAGASRFYARPDVAFVSVTGTAPIDWAPVWLRANNSPLVRAFARCMLEAAIDIHPDAASLGPSPRTAPAGRQAGPSRTGPESAAR
jgi:DNA-binding transcriptional LysR family regulator